MCASEEGKNVMDSQEKNPSGLRTWPFYSAERGEGEMAAGRPMVHSFSIVLQMADS